MTPADPRELLDIAMLHARRLARDLWMMEPDALGVAGEDMAHRYVRDRHASALRGLIADLEEAVKKGGAA